MRSTNWAPEGIDPKRLREQERDLERQLRIVRKLLATLEAEGFAGPARKRRRRANTRLSQIVAALRDEGRPLPVQAIYEKLREKDPGMSWKQPSAAFRSYLRDQEGGPDMVVKVTRGVYGLKAWEEEPPAKDDTPTDDSENVRGPWDD